MPRHYFYVDCRFLILSLGRIFEHLHLHMRDKPVPLEVSGHRNTFSPRLNPNLGNLGISTQKMGRGNLVVVSEGAGRRSCA